MRFLFLAGFIGLAAIQSARADCTNLPEPASAYLKANPDWQVMTLDAWDKDSIAEWRKLNKDACPGLATVDLDGKGPSYAIFLRKPGNGETERKLVVVQRRAGKLGTRILIPAYRSGTEEFVLPAKPGRYTDHYDGRRYAFEHGGVLFGEWDAGSSIYYLSGGRVRSFQNSI